MTVEAEWLPSLHSFVNQFYMVNDSHVELDNECEDPTVRIEMLLVSGSCVTAREPDFRTMITAIRKLVPRQYRVNFELEFQL